MMSLSAWLGTQAASSGWRMPGRSFQGCRSWAGARALSRMGSMLLQDFPALARPGCSALGCLQSRCFAIVLWLCLVCLRCQTRKTPPPSTHQLCVRACYCLAHHLHLHVSVHSQTELEKVTGRMQAQTQCENWVGVLQEVALPSAGGTVESFLSAAVDFCNSKCRGSLSASIFVHPHVQKTFPEAVEAAIADLQYGSIGVNVPSFICFAIPYMAWGAFPGSQPHVSTQTPAHPHWAWPHL